MLSTPEEINEALARVAEIRAKQRKARHLVNRLEYSILKRALPHDAKRAARFHFLADAIARHERQLRNRNRKGD